MPRDYKAYINDILEAIDRIESYTTDLTFDDFSESRLYQDAVVRNLEIIGEAVKRVQVEGDTTHDAKDDGVVEGLLQKLIVFGEKVYIVHVAQAVAL